MLCRSKLDFVYTLMEKQAQFQKVNHHSYLQQAGWWGLSQAETNYAKAYNARAERMTFTRSWLRRLITNFHEMARLVCQDTTHKCEEITLTTFRRAQTKQVKGMEWSRWCVMQSKLITKCYAREEVSAIQVPGAVWGDELTDLKNVWLRREWCAWVTVQQMCHGVTCVPLTCFSQ